MRDAARELKANMPKSEIWFHDLRASDGIIIHGEDWNEPFCGFIPDVINRKFGYIIEVQDPTHKAPERIEKDRIRLNVFKSHGYMVFEVWAWNDDSYQKFKECFYQTVINTKRCGPDKTHTQTHIVLKRENKVLRKKSKSLVKSKRMQNLAQSRGWTRPTTNHADIFKKESNLKKRSSFAKEYAEKLKTRS